jgi:demethylmenaquinone methyltransferase/2-methoxy-6-polyprenyl-1,4-benzoquinol methylase
LAELSGNERAQYVQSMFARIAKNYELMNRVMTFCQDSRWRRVVIRLAGLPEGGGLLDLGAGTGNLTIDSGSRYPGSISIAADFTIEMMKVGRHRLETGELDLPNLAWTAVDAHFLPFSANTFDAVVSGFLARNLADLPASLREQYRVIKPGGRVVILDTTPPPSSLLSPFIKFHLHRIIPLLGRIITGNPEAYTYLPDTTVKFLEPEQLTNRLLQAGFKQLSFQRFMFGTIAIHSGVK